MTLQSDHTRAYGRLGAALRVGGAHSIAIALGLGLVWLASQCRAKTDSCEFGGLAFLALFAVGAGAATLAITVPVARRLMFDRFEGTTRALWRYLIVTVGLRLLFVIPPLWVLALFDLAIIDALLPDAHGTIFIGVAAVTHGLGAFVFALVSLRRPAIDA